MVLPLALIAALFTASAGASTTATATLDALAGSWNDLDSFATLGQCIASPSDSLYYLCSPAHLSRVKKPRFEGRGMVSATDSVLKIGDALRNENVNSQEVNLLFRDYNYSDLLVNVDLNYVAKNFLVGVRPVRYQGQFQIHNPNLPLASLSYRKDMDAHAGTGYVFGSADWSWSAGAMGTFLIRDDSLVEASLVELASRPGRDLVNTQKLRGYFFDLGTSIEFRQFVTFSLLGRDFGDWLGGRQEQAGRYLFLHPDKLPKLHAAFAVTPYLLGGRFQIGASTLHFLNQKNDLGEQWFATLSYYAGPLRILSGFRENLLRTGLAMRFERFEVNVAQEWINTLEQGRKAQPRFSLEVTSGL